ncbi:19408_t:CDS:2, partial [Entrophospora sp. SA101]
VVVFEPKALIEQDVEAMGNNENQAVGELFAANVISSEKPKSIRNIPDFPFFDKRAQVKSKFHTAAYDENT